MHPAACALCGDMIEVPFIPRGDRPVYCSTVKRLMTQGYELGEIDRTWGKRPCQNPVALDGLRRGTIPAKEPVGDGRVPGGNGQRVFGGPTGRA